MNIDSSSSSQKRWQVARIHVSDRDQFERTGGKFLSIIRVRNPRQRLRTVWEDRWWVFINNWSQNPLTILGFGGWRVRKPHIRIHEIVKYETPKKWETHWGAKNWWTCLVLAIRHFRIQEIGVPCYGFPKATKCGMGVEQDTTKDFDVSGFRVSIGGRTENLDNKNHEIVKPEVLCALNKRGWLTLSMVVVKILSGSRPKCRGFASSVHHNIFWINRDSGWY